MHSPIIVVVDDDENVRHFLRLMLERDFPHSQVLTHHSAAEALSELRSREADLLITDCNMPGMDGPTLVKTLREGGFTLPIIMISGGKEARRLGEAAGIDRYLDKFSVTTDLARTVKLLLEPQQFPFAHDNPKTA